MALNYSLHFKTVSEQVVYKNAERVGSTVIKNLSRNEVLYVNHNNQYDNYYMYPVTE